MHNLWVPSLSSAIETVLQLWINRWSMSLSSLARRHKLPVTSISQPYKHRLCLPLPQIAEGSNFCICSVSEKMNHDTLKPETRKIVSLLWSSIWFEVWHFGVVSPDHTLLCITTSAENAFAVSAEFLTSPCICWKGAWSSLMRSHLGTKARSILLHYSCTLSTLQLNSW